MPLRPYDAARDQALVLAWANAPDSARWLAEHGHAIEASDVAAWCAEPQATQWMLEREGQAVGFGTIRVDESGGYVRFGRLLVDPTRRRQGIGRELARAVAAQAGALRPGWPVYTRIAPGNLAALLLYPSADLVPLEPLPAGFDDTYLWLTVLEHEPTEPGGSFDDDAR